MKRVKKIAQKMKFSIKDFFKKCDQIRRKLRIWSHLLKKTLMEKTGKSFQEIIVKFRGFVQRTKMYRVRKHKADISIHTDLTKRRCLLLKYAYAKAKDCTSVTSLERMLIVCFVYSGRMVT